MCRGEEVKPSSVKLGVDVVGRVRATRSDEDARRRRTTRPGCVLLLLCPSVTHEPVHSLLGRSMGRSIDSYFLLRLLLLVQNH
jgi:hypothetical protein